MGKRGLTIVGIISAVVLMVTIPLMTACTPSTTEKVTWKFVQNFAVNHWYTIEAQKMIDAVSEKTDGMFTIEMYVMATLYPGQEHFTACADGLVEMCECPGGYAAQHLPLLGFSDLALLFPTIDDMLAVYDSSKVRDKIESACLGVGVKPIGPTASFGGIFLFTLDEIRSMQDLAGVPIRAGGKWTPKAIQALGGSGVSIPGEERYTAMQRGTVRGEVTSLGSHVAQKTYEFCSYAIQEPPFAQPEAQIYANLNAWNALPKKYQDVLSDAIDEMVPVARKRVVEVNEESWVFLQGEGNEVLVTLSAEETARWQSALKPMWEEWAAEVGPDGQELLQLAMEAMK